MAGSGDLHLGATLVLTVSLSQAVAVSGGTPTLVLNDGGVATYTGGSGSNALTFSYTVAAGQNTADLTVTDLHLNGATVASAPATVTVGSGQSVTDGNGHVWSFGGGGGIFRDGVNYGGIGATLVKDVDGVVWTQNSQSEWYEVVDGGWKFDPAGPTLPGGGLTADLTGAITNPAGILQVDTTTGPSGPAVTSVVASGSGIMAGSGDLHLGATVVLTVSLSEAVAVSGGTPTLVLNDGGVATYTGGSGSNALAFSYTVAAGQNTADLTVTDLHLNGATVASAPATVTVGSGQSVTDGNGHVWSFGGGGGIFRDGVNYGGIGATLVKDVDGVVWTQNSQSEWYEVVAGGWKFDPAGPTLPGGGLTADLTGAITNPAGILQVDTTTGPSGPAVTSVVASGSGITAGSGDLHLGATVVLTVSLSEAVAVSGGTPTLVLNDGGIATYTGGSGSNALAFSYTVAAGQNTADLTVTDLHLNGATLASAPATVTVGSGQSVTDGNGHAWSFGGGGGIFRDGVNYGGIGATLVKDVDGVVWTQNSQSDWYEVVAGGWKFDPAGPTLPGGGLTADLTGAITNPAGILQVDTTTGPSGPAVTSVVASGSGITAGSGDLHLGATVVLTLSLSEAVAVSGGTPTLVLNDGGIATYTGGSGSNALAFSYTVAAGQNTADLTVTVNGATLASAPATVTVGSGQSVTDQWSRLVLWRRRRIFRDGVNYADRCDTCQNVDGVVWTQNSQSDWYEVVAGGWKFDPAGPTLPGGGLTADLTGAITNPAGILQVDTTTGQTVSATPEPSNFAVAQIAGENADGETYTAASLIAGFEVTGGPSRDSLVANGTAQEDSRLASGNYQDTFIFPPNLGNDTITGFPTTSATVINHDTLEFQSFFTNTGAVLYAPHDVGGDVMISFDEKDHTTLTEFQKANLSASDFHFV